MMLEKSDLFGNQRFSLANETEVARILGDMQRREVIEESKNS
jgi:hypothetical protein